MTLTEIKNKLARDCGKTDWTQLLSGQADFMIESYWEKVAYMYAESKWDQACEEMHESVCRQFCDGKSFPSSVLGKVVDAPKPDFNYQ